MSQKKAISLSSIFFLQLCLGVFFLMLGIVGLGHYNSKLSEVARFFGRDDTMSVVMSVIELVMGGILILGLFVRISGSLAKVFSIALFVLWAIYMFINFFMNKSFLEPSEVVWLYNFSWNAIILVSLWVVGKKYME
jgi:hypothetical protein